jgi:hypothetical protein
VRLVAVWLCLCWAFCGTATAEEPTPYEWRYRASASIVLGSVFSNQSELPIGPRLVVSVQPHPIAEFEIAAAYMVDSSEDFSAWAISGRMKWHPTLGGVGVRRFYLLTGLGVLGASNRATGVSFEVGAGYSVPLWNHIGLQVEMTYVYATTKPKLSATVSSIGLQWEF